MANYLARVAASGASNQPVARPSLIAPPILPGRAPAPEPEQPVAPRSRPLLSSPVVGTERTLRPEPDQAANLPQPATAQSGVNLPAADVPPVRPVNPEPTRFVSGATRPEPARSADPNIIRAPRRRPAAAQGETPRQFDFRPEPDAVVYLPRSLGRAQLFAASDSLASAAPEIERPPSPAIASPARSPEPDMPARPPANATQVAEREPAGVRGEPIERRIISVPRVGTGSVVVEMPNAGSARREPKITIGQIDVQVINTPAAAPAQPAAPPASSNVTNVDLERVRWRPL